MKSPWVTSDLSTTTNHLRLLQFKTEHLSTGISYSTLSVNTAKITRESDICQLACLVDVFKDIQGTEMDGLYSPET